jgi:hypothetical protein
MNPAQAKQILTIYRPGTADADDPEIAEALALVRTDPELSRWFDEHCARQTALRDKFRQIALPAGLREQIISEHTAHTKAASRREKIVGVVAVAVILMALALLGFFYLPHNNNGPIPNTLANYQDQMMSAAASGYDMTTMTNLDQVHSWLAQKQAPIDYVLPAGLKNAAVTGCTIQTWRNTRASMICFRQGETLPPGQPGDLWLFVIDQTAVNGAPTTTSPQLTKVNGLITATWTEGGELYLLGARGDEQTIQKYL